MLVWIFLNLSRDGTELRAENLSVRSEKIGVFLDFVGNRHIDELEKRLKSACFFDRNTFMSVYLSPRATVMPPRRELSTVEEMTGVWFPSMEATASATSDF